MTLALVLFLIVLLVLDWRQTLRIFEQRRRELNPVIRWVHARWGRRGVDGYFAACIALVLLLDAFYANAFIVLAIVAAVQAFVVIRNYRLGIRA